MFFFQPLQCVDFAQLFTNDFRFFILRIQISPCLTVKLFEIAGFTNQTSKEESNQCETLGS